MADFVLISPENTLPIHPIDWNLYFLCQLKLPKSIPIISPWKRNGFDRDDQNTYGIYTTLAQSLENWVAANELSLSLKKRVFDLI